jgi:hypothetical protein
MNKQNKIKIGMFLIVGILLVFTFASVSATWKISNPKYTSSNWQSNKNSDIDWKKQCEAGQDFVVQVAPFGCTPAVVRSDLLEEQNVPVFCKLQATKINPLITVEAIESISFKDENYNKDYVQGVGFHPAKAALGSGDKLNSPILSNIGYAVIVLKKQDNVNSTPEIISGNLTAKLKYDIEDAFGIGKADFNLPLMGEQEWDETFESYGFWGRRGFLRADGIDESGATITVYERDGGQIARLNLDKGETSREFSLPSLDDCFARFKLKLVDVGGQDTYAKLAINGDIFQLVEGQKFLDNHCTVKDVDKRGLSQKVKISCKTDYKRGDSFWLEINPKVSLTIEGVTGEYKVGDKLFDLDVTVPQLDGNGDVAKDSSGEIKTTVSRQHIYLSYVGRDPKKGLFIVPILSELDEEEFSKSWKFESAKGLENFLGRISGSVFDVSILKGLNGWNVGPSIYVGEEKEAEFIRGKVARQADEFDTMIDVFYENLDYATALWGEKLQENFMGDYHSLERKKYRYVDKIVEKMKANKKDQDQPPKPNVPEPTAEPEAAPPTVTDRVRKGVDAVKQLGEGNLTWWEKGRNFFLGGKKGSKSPPITGKVTGILDFEKIVRNIVEGVEKTWDEIDEQTKENVDKLGKKAKEYFIYGETGSGEWEVDYILDYGEEQVVLTGLTLGKKTQPSETYQENKPKLDDIKSIRDHLDNLKDAISFRKVSSGPTGVINVATIVENKILGLKAGGSSNFGNIFKDLKQNIKDLSGSGLTETIFQKSIYDEFIDQENRLLPYLDEVEAIYNKKHIGYIDHLYIYDSAKQKIGEIYYPKEKSIFGGKQVYIDKEVMSREFAELQEAKTNYENNKLNSSFKEQYLRKLLYFQMLESFNYNSLICSRNSFDNWLNYCYFDLSGDESYLMDVNMIDAWTLVKDEAANKANLEKVAIDFENEKARAEELNKDGWAKAEISVIADDGSVARTAFLESGESYLISENWILTANKVELDKASLVFINSKFETEEITFKLGGGEEHKVVDSKSSNKYTTRLVNIDGAEANGIPDWWETFYELRGGANGDDDGDKHSNLVEYKAKTDPQDEDSYPDEGAFTEFVKGLREGISKAKLPAPDAWAKLRIFRHQKVNIRFEGLADNRDTFDLTEKDYGSCIDDYAEFNAGLCKAGDRVLISLFNSTSGKSAWVVKKDDDEWVYVSFAEFKLASGKVLSSKIAGHEKNPFEDAEISSFYNGKKGVTDAEISGFHLGGENVLSKVDFEAKLDLIRKKGEAGLNEDKVNYKLASQDFKKVIGSFGGEIYQDLRTRKKELLGEEAMFYFIKLSSKTGQMKTLIDLCEEFKNSYESSKYFSQLYSYCSGDVRKGSSGTFSRDLVINGRVKEIVFEGIYEPDLEDFSATIRISGLENGAESFTLGKNEVHMLNDVEYIQLVDLTDDKAKLKVDLYASGFVSSGRRVAEIIADKATLGRASRSRTVTLNREEIDSFGSNYNFALTDIKLNKVAKVGVIPSITDTSSEVNFSFNIGVEQRSIKLTPEKTKEMVSKLDNKIESWQEKSEKLGTVVKGMKGACLATGATLLVTSFIGNWDGTSSARRKVMEEGNWKTFCTKEVADKRFVSIQACLAANNDHIEADVKRRLAAHAETNRVAKLAQAEGADGKTTVVESGPIKGTVHNTELVKKRTVEGEGSNLLSFKERLIKKGIIEIPNGEFKKDVNGKQIPTMVKLRDVPDEKLNKLLMDNRNLEDIQAWEEEAFLAQNGGLAKVDADKFKKKVQDGLSELVYKEGKREEERQSLQAEYGKKVKGIQVDVLSSKERQPKYFEGPVLDGTSSGLNFLNKEKYKGSTPYVAVVGSKPYVLALRPASGNDYVVQDEGIFDEKGDLVPKTKMETVGDKQVEVPNPEYDRLMTQFSKFKFAKKQEGMFPEKYLLPTVRFYETEPYKGMPAVVPVGESKGWYAYIKHTIPYTNNIRSYDESGRVYSMYLCHVGNNEREEAMGGDDECWNVNRATKVVAIPYLSESEKRTLVKNAENSIERVSKQYKKGVRKVSIPGLETIDVANPMAAISQMECTNFMSAKSCQILFNVCDPVICPSSRCNLGGKFSVSNVVQSGIIGSLALCLPNWHPFDYTKGVIIPICLSGVKAGIDGWLSVLTSYRDCLDDSLETGKMVGICDEIYSIHACEFFWRQALPFTDIIIPKTLEILLGQNTRGGGEYLNVASAWENMQDTVSFFTNDYAVNSYKAFKARTSETVGDAVCKNSISAVYPSGGDVLDKLTDPDSPPQYHGRFDEIPFTTATNPPQSQYKVFYHIYAGNDSRAYYQIYLTGAAGSSFYQDSGLKKTVDSGYISVGGTVSETKDFLAQAGYNQMCIVVNGQEECGFKQVSTSFAVDYVKDQYMGSIAEQRVTSEEDCISGDNFNLWGIANNAMIPSSQGMAEELANPAIYNRGIVRVCGSVNPGKGIDGKWNTEKARWKDVGYCGNSDLRCWLDTETVKETIQHTGIEEKALASLTNSYLEILNESGDYITDPKDIYNIIDRLENWLLGVGLPKMSGSSSVTLTDKSGPISGTGATKSTQTPEQDKRYDTVILDIDTAQYYDKMFWSNAKGKIYLLRALAYAGKASVQIEETRAKISEEVDLLETSEGIDQFNTVQNNLRREDDGAEFVQTPPEELVEGDTSEDVLEMKELMLLGEGYVTQGNKEEAKNILDKIEQKRKESEYIDALLKVNPNADHDSLSTQYAILREKYFNLNSDSAAVPAPVPVAVKPNVVSPEKQVVKAIPTEPATEATSKKTTHSVYSLVRVADQVLVNLFLEKDCVLKGELITGDRDGLVLTKEISLDQVPPTSSNLPRPVGFEFASYVFVTQFNFARVKDLSAIFWCEGNKEDQSVSGWYDVKRKFGFFGNYYLKQR